MTHRIAVALVLMLAAEPLVVSAQEARTTRLVVAESATRELEQDTLVTTLAVRAEATAAHDAQGRVNAAMADAIERTGAVEGLDRFTGGYRVHQRRDRDGPPTGWIAEQELRLRSGDATALLSLVGELQEDGLLLRGIAYELSREARRVLENELAVEAIAALETRAERIAAAMDMAVEAFATVRVGGTAATPPVRPFLQARGADAEAVPPTALPDREAVEVTVEAEIDLVPR